ncbi:UNVERIFIED_CONTAM: hypothetical protein FKN15_067422 [Acipenser sinensis]
MRHHWLLLGACGWVLLILMFASKFINFSFRIPDDYGGKPEPLGWTVIATGDAESPSQVPKRKRPDTEHQAFKPIEDYGGKPEPLGWTVIATGDAESPSQVPKRKRPDTEHQVYYILQDFRYAISVTKMCFPEEHPEVRVTV